MMLRRSGSLETPEEDSEGASPSSDAPEWTGVSFRRQRSLRSHDDIGKFIIRQAGSSFSLFPATRRPPLEVAGRWSFVADARRSCSAPRSFEFVRVVWRDVTHSPAVAFCTRFGCQLKGARR